MNDSNLKILILGGCGFIGRCFLDYLLKEQLVSFIRVIDKITPILSDMHPSHLINYQSNLVQFIQIDLTQKDQLDRVFKISNSNSNSDNNSNSNSSNSFDYVFNAAGETRYGQSEHLYATRCSDLSYKCALKSLDYGVKRFIELSTSFIYDCTVSLKCKEDSTINPIILQAKYKYEAEQRLLQLSSSSTSTSNLSSLSNNNDNNSENISKSLDVVILRPSIVYGCGDTHLLMTRIACAALYHYSLHETMTLPYSSQLEINTVHINDVCRAMWFCTNQDIIPSGTIFNLSDKSFTTQETFTAILSDIIGVRYDYYGYVINTFLRHRASDVLGYINNKHITAWSQLCQFYNVSNTPISPYITPENLLDLPLSIDGSFIESYGFQYNYPLLHSDEIKRSLLFAIETGIFPAIIS